MTHLIQKHRLADVDTAPLVHRAQDVDPEVVQAAALIVEHVRRDRDKALRELTRRFEGADLEDPFLSDADWDAGAAACPPEVQAAIRGNLARIRAFHARQVGGEDLVEVAPGVTLGRRPVPYDAVGCYVPGGRASYPSTVLMTVAPAVLAGVPRIVVTTPPRRDGSVDSAVLFAAREAGATHVLRAGGAQAIAALALGTPRVPAVDAIVGPGNAYVTAAKRLAGDLVHTDAPAGPSELLVLADKTATARPIALDLVAQAEHDPDAQVLLVTDHAPLADAVAAELEGLVPAAARREVVEASLRDHGVLLVADSWDEACRFADAYAPEHLEIHSRDPRADLERVRRAGSVFLGPHSPVPLGDYGSGTNHVLPTMGFARLRGGLSVDDFRTWVTWQEVTPEGLAAIGPDVARLAEAEGLHGHAEAVRARLEGRA